jgi:riboflavin-specific deaminase-like protein
MEPISQNTLWEALLTLRSLISLSQNSFDEYSIVFNNGACQVCQGDVAEKLGQKVIAISRNPKCSYISGKVLFFIDNNNSITQLGDSFLDTPENNFLKQYLPLCFSKDIAHNLSRTYSVLHLAQSIDGKIATKTGQSKWIGNRENLIHAHRMRALCDAILVGNNTMKMDSPMLNVRHVSGPNPVKVLIANTPCNLDNLKKSDSKVLLFTSKNIGAIEGVEIITLPDSQGFILSDLILKELYKRNIFSIFIEGGAITASHFVMENTVDKIQLFISPQIFGSGINSFTLPTIDAVGESRSFLNPTFQPMGNGILFEGDLIHKKPEAIKVDKRVQERLKYI